MPLTFEALVRSFVPQGQPKIAQPFKAGCGIAAVSLSPSLPRRNPMQAGEGERAGVRGSLLGAGTIMAAVSRLASSQFRVFLRLGFLSFCASPFCISSEFGLFLRLVFLS